MTRGRDHNIAYLHERSTARESENRMIQGQAAVIRNQQHAASVLRVIVAMHQKVMTAYGQATTTVRESQPAVALGAIGQRAMKLRQRSLEYSCWHTSLVGKLRGSASLAASASA